MHIILIIALLFSNIQNQSDSDSLLLNQSKEQAHTYINSINQGFEKEANIWALTTLYQSHPEIQKHIVEKIQIEKYRDPFLQPFISPKLDVSNILKEIVMTTGSPSLLVELILQTPDTQSRNNIKRKFKEKFGLSRKNNIDYEALTDHIIRGTSIDFTVLPNESFHLSHLFLLTDSKGNSLLSDQYKLSTLNKWENKISSTDSVSLNQVLKRISYFTLMYFSDEFNGTKPFYDFLTNNKLFPNSILKIKIFRYYDYSMYRLGYYDLSLSMIKNHTIPLAKLLNNKRHELSALSAQAAYLDHIGKIREAQNINLEILEITEQSNIPIPKSTVFTNLGLTYKESGEFNKHLDLQIKALEEAENQENYNKQIKILLILHHSFLESKDKKSALLYLNKANELAEKHGSPEHMGRVNLFFGLLFRDLDKDYEKSLKYFQKAQHYFDPETNFKNYVQLLDEKAELYQSLGKPELSRTIYNQIVDLSKEKDKVTLLISYLEIIELDLKSGNLDAAGKLLDEVYSYDLNQLDFIDIIKAKTVEADYLIATGNPEKAYDVMKPTIEQVVERAKSSTDMQSGYWHVAPQYLDAFRLTADLLIETGKEVEAVDLLDKLKTINDASLYQNPMVKSSLLDEKELTQYQRLTGQLDDLRKKQLLASEKEQLNIQSKISQLTAQKNVLDRKITGMVDQKPISVSEVQRQLSGRELVLHITELQDQYYIARISRHEVNFNKIKLDSTLRARFDSAIQNLSVGKTDIDELSYISGILDLENIPSWVNTLTIIPDSYLYQLPIDVLPVKSNAFGYSYGEATYVVEQFKTHYLTSLNDFRPDKKGKKDYKWDFAGYGVSDFPSNKNRKNLVPLPYAGSEVTNIVSNMSNMSHKAAFLDSASTEQNFKETASQARILHLATHSELSERDPLFSTLYMSADKTVAEDDNFSGQIFAYELFELNLSNDLIMLNSCESGSGSYLQGTGVMGISRALRYAGASSLILNLWSVNDMMASDFAIEFYKNINEGLAKDEALRQAKLHFLENKNANPHYWGPYILIGNRDPLVSPNRETNIYFAGAFMLFFITIASISLFHDRKEKAA